jgi:hypothetical protein
VLLTSNWYYSGHLCLVREELCCCPVLESRKLCLKSLIDIGIRVIIEFIMELPFTSIYFLLEYLFMWLKKLETLEHCKGEIVASILNLGVSVPSMSNNVAHRWRRNPYISFTHCNKMMKYNIKHFEYVQFLCER